MRKLILTFAFFTLTIFASAQTDLKKESIDYYFTYQDYINNNLKRQ